ncbi:MAG: zf-HC2 domain-containing protein [Clostridiaceae bacterium]|jgi:hypothetical protein|nr:zf-HC2 domain-containing protein [Clostridiaceae bacterium]
MDCRQAWNLMMKGFDKEISQLQEKELNMHLDVCDSCKTRFENLNEAFAALDATDIEAPPDIEKTVMAKLNSVKHKRDFLMPYVISNLIVFVGIIALWLDNIFRIGIFEFLKDAFNEVVLAYNTSTAVFTVLQILVTYFIKPVLNIIISAGLIYGVLSIILTLQRMRRRHVSVR